MDTSEHVGAWVSNPLFSVSDGGQLLFVVEAPYLEEAELRADCVCLLLGLPSVPGRAVMLIGECPQGTPAFLEGFFAPTGPGGPALVERRRNMH